MSQFFLFVIGCWMSWLYYFGCPGFILASLALVLALGLVIAHITDTIEIIVRLLEAINGTCRVKE